MKMTLSQVLAHEARLGIKKTQAMVHSDGSEAALHDQIATEIKRRGWYYVRSRMDRRTTTQRGVPDFIIAADEGRVFWIEAKTPKGKLRPEQIGAIKWLEICGHKAHVVRSIEDFLKVIS